MENDIISLRGVKVHNLKNIDLDIPLHKLIIITGVSGSGKSSLAFDTLYAEGQRRFIESLSAYARQFLERMEKPDADTIEGITPAIAIQQKAVSKNPRSTVATITEIYDFLRVLYARAGIIHCLECGLPVVRDTIDSIVDILFKNNAGKKITVFFSWPMERGIEELQREGFYRIFYRGKVVDIKETDLTELSTIDVYVDSLSVEQQHREQLVDSLEAALRKGNGRVHIKNSTGELQTFSDQLECKSCMITFQDPVPNLFSFNSPQGACPVCHGFGDQAIFDVAKIIPDQNLSLAEGAVEPWTKPVSRRRMRKLLEEAEKRGIPIDVPYKKLSNKSKDFILNGAGSYKGVMGFFDRLHKKKYKVQIRVFLSRYRKYIPCPGCDRMRLNPQALSVKLNGKSIGEVTRKTVKEAWDFFAALRLSPFQQQIAEKLLQEINSRLQFLLEVGLDYISLDRMTFTLSGGEAQRINLAAALSASLVGTLFVLDEPSIGLHARDNHRLIEILKSLKEIGNTVIVVEHDPEIIAAAEYLVDLGPQAGDQGGEVVFAGPMQELKDAADSLTADYIYQRKSIKIPDQRLKPSRFITIKDAHLHNLKHIDVNIPLDIFSCVTGVSGSGKSTLLFDLLYQGWQGKNSCGYKKIAGTDKIDSIILVDQSPLSTSPRSIPATYTKAMDDIRDLMSRTREASAQGYKPGFFSFNTSGGRCEECKGAGRQIVEMQFLSDVVLTCEACKGKRFKSEILEVKYQNKNIDEILQLSILAALDFFRDAPKIVRKLLPLVEVGLGYLKLGQPTTTLSGGELQRIKLAHNLVHQKNKKILYLFDEPTIGLHPHDVSVLIQCFRKLVAEGHSVVVIEHNLDIIKCADYMIDLGPEGGDAGGEIVVQGTPEECLHAARSHTAKYLKKQLS